MRFSFNKFVGALLLSTALSSVALAQQRMDQLGAAAAVQSTDGVALCQGCDVDTPLTTAPVSALVTFLNSNLSLSLSRITSGLGSGVSTWLGTPSSANLRTVLTDETGTGVAVFGTGPTLNDPILSGRANALLRVDGSGVPQTATSGTHYTLMTTTNCTGTDKVSAISASGTVTCSADSAGGGTVTTTDGTNSVSNTTTQTFGTGFVVGGSGGSATVNLTSVSNDQSAGAYTVLAGDAAKTVLVGGGFTYALPQAGSTGFGSGWGACFLNVGASNATLNTTTSTFKGASGTTSLTIRPGSWACPASDGTNYATVFGANGFGLSANAPLIGGGAGAVPTTGTRSGNTTEFVTATGSKTTDNCAKWDANDNAVDAGVNCGAESLMFAFSDKTTPITAGTAKEYFRMPYAMTLTGVRASLGTACTTGTFTIDINQNGTTVLSTKLTFDNTEKTTVTAAVPAVISNSALVDDGEITADVDATCSGGDALDGKITLIGVRA